MHTSYKPTAGGGRCDNKNKQTRTHTKQHRNAYTMSNNHRRQSLRQTKHNNNK